MGASAVRQVVQHRVPIWVHRGHPTRSVLFDKNKGPVLFSLSLSARLQTLNVHSAAQDLQKAQVGSRGAPLGSSTKAPFSCRASPDAIHFTSACSTVPASASASASDYFLCALRSVAEGPPSRRIPFLCAPRFRVRQSEANAQRAQQRRAMAPRAPRPAVLLPVRTSERLGNGKRPDFRGVRGGTRVQCRAEASRPASLRLCHLQAGPVKACPH